MWLRRTVVYKKEALTLLIEEPLGRVAARCAEVWPASEALDDVLRASIGGVPYCHLLYAVSMDGVQLSANVGRQQIDIRYRGQQLAGRPYQEGHLPYRGLVLSTVYVSRVSRKRCITALQAVSREGRLLGFIAADFNVDEIPLPDAGDRPDTGEVWTQYRGDPAIRGTVFQHKRMKSVLDARMDEAMETLDTLMREHGVYHIILHFSSSRAIFWVYDDPYRYRFHGVDEFLDPEIWLAYPSQHYPIEAIVAPGQIRAVLDQFRNLRESDENIYLRSGSLNLMNGIVGLTFSCDGSHYLSVEEFLNKEHPFWGM